MNDGLVVWRHLEQHISFVFFIRCWYARGSVVLILRSEKWPFSVAP